MRELTRRSNKAFNSLVGPPKFHIDLSERIRIRNLLEEKCEIARKLPPRKKLLFLMYFDHGHSIKEIAELCKVKESSVNQRLQRVCKEINKIENSEKGETDV